MSIPSAPIYPEIIKTFKVDPNDPFEPLKPSNGGHGIRLKEIDRIRNRLEKQVDARKRIYKSYKRFYNILHGISIGSSSLAGLLAGVTLGFIANPVLILPLGVTNASLAGIGTVSSIWSRLISKRILKHEKLWLLANSTLSTINELLSESLKDSHISDKEFKQILNIHQEYLLNCKSLKDVFARKTFVDKDDIQRKINEALSDR